MLQSVGIDFLTITNVHSDNAKRRPLLPIFERMAGAKAGWKGGGYGGWSDPDTGLKYGSRERLDSQVDEIIIAPSEASFGLARMVENPSPYRATRIDLQLTCTLPEPDPELAERMYGDLVKSKKEGKGKTGRRKLVFMASDTGQTLYLGSRKSGRKYFRLYDKGKDIDQSAGKHWRTEIQYGRDLAPGAFQCYQDNLNNPEGIIDLVSAEFWDAMEFSLYTHANFKGVIITGSAKEKVRLEKKLRWLKECVRPTIALLIDNDLELEMTEALGLRKRPKGRTNKG